MGTVSIHAGPALGWQPWMTVGPLDRLVGRHGAESGISLSRCSLGLSPSRGWRELSTLQPPRIWRRMSSQSPPPPPAADGTRGALDSAAGVRPTLGGYVAPLAPPLVGGASQDQQLMLETTYTPAPAPPSVALPAPHAQPRLPVSISPACARVGFARAGRGEVMDRRQSGHTRHVRADGVGGFFGAGGEWGRQ